MSYIVVICYVVPVIIFGTKSSNFSKLLQQSAIFFAQLNEKNHAQSSCNPTRILTALNFINIQDLYNIINNNNR